jgi:hypothetical protein
MERCYSQARRSGVEPCYSAAIAIDKWMACASPDLGCSPQESRHCSRSFPDYFFSSHRIDDCLKLFICINFHQVSAEVSPK